MSLSAKLRLGIVLVLWAPIAAAQSNLGELLDAGAKKLSAEEFRKELTQRIIVGTTVTGGSVEVMYANSGQIQGVATGQFTPRLVSISGEWKIDATGAVCTSMYSAQVALPYRCQIWFKYKDQYFLSDSDSDRSARVLLRTLKQ